ncbi:hypothetical protein [Sorangium sp. So ce131]|uniref:hypothetical protein n=1 Tax=Sorangium sp. So ce131 TaxID=3133282 RepID=UPI003F5F560E
MIWEIERYDWSSLRAAGDASGIPAAIRQLESANAEAEASVAYWKIDNVVVVQGAVYQAALATVPCLIEILLRCTRAARRQVLELLVQIGSGEESESELAHGEVDLIQRCLRELSRGVAIYLHILESSSDPDERALCVDLLGLSCRADGELRERVSWYLSRLRSEKISEGLQSLMSSWFEELGPSTP